VVSRRAPDGDERAVSRQPPRPRPRHICARLGGRQHDDRRVAPRSPAADSPRRRAGSADRSRRRNRVPFKNALLELASDGVWVAALLAARQARQRACRRMDAATPNGDALRVDLPGPGTQQHQPAVVPDRNGRGLDVLQLRELLLPVPCTADARRALRYSCGNDEVVERRPPHPSPPVETKRRITATARGELIELRHEDGRTRNDPPAGPSRRHRTGRGRPLLRLHHDRAVPRSSGLRPLRSPTPLALTQCTSAP
jgi:hypothetical protein